MWFLAQHSWCVIDKVQKNPLEMHCVHSHDTSHEIWDLLSYCVFIISKFTTILEKCYIYIFCITVLFMNMDNVISISVIAVSKIKFQIFVAGLLPLTIFVNIFYFRCSFSVCPK